MHNRVTEFHFQYQSDARAAEIMMLCGCGKCGRRTAHFDCHGRMMTMGFIMCDPQANLFAMCPECCKNQEPDCE